MTQKTYYEILGVSKDASLEDIKHAYRQLVLEYHPDMKKGHDPNIFIAIDEAFDTLKDPDYRREYDLKLKMQDDNYEIPIDNDSSIYRSKKYTSYNSGYDEGTFNTNTYSSNESGRYNSYRTIPINNTVGDYKQDSNFGRNFLVVFITILCILICVIIVPDINLYNRFMPLWIKIFMGFAISLIINFFVVLFSSPMRRTVNPDTSFLGRISALCLISFLLGFCLIILLFISILFRPININDCFGTFAIFCMAILFFYVAYDNYNKLG